MQMRWILMIPQKFYPTHHAMLETVYSRLLPTYGYKITWLMLSGDVKQLTHTRWNDTDVILFPTIVGRGILSFVSQMYSWLWLLGYAAWLLVRNPIDIVQVRNSVRGALLIWMLKRFLSVRFVYQFSFPIPESLIQAAREGRTRLPWLQIRQGRLQIKLRNWLLKKADLVLAISEQMRSDLIELGVAQEKVISFPLGTECPPQPSEEQVQQVRKRLGTVNAPIVLYFGTMTRERQLDFLVRVAAIVNAKKKETIWLFVGDGPAAEMQRLKRLADENGMTAGLRFIGRVPREEIPTYLAVANVSVSPIPPTALFWFSSPTKAVESLAGGCPVVATDIPDQAQLLSDSQGGVIAPFEEQAFAQSVLTLLDNPSQAKEMGQAGATYVREFRSYASLSRQIHHAYCKVLCVIADDAVDLTNKTIQSG